jgi:hypothetical protein
MKESFGQTKSYRFIIVTICIPSKIGHFLSSYAVPRWISVPWAELNASAQAVTPVFPFEIFRGRVIASICTLP